MDCSGRVLGSRTIVRASIGFGGQKLANSENAGASRQQERILRAWMAISSSWEKRFWEFFDPRVDVALIGAVKDIIRPLAWFILSGGATLNLKFWNQLFLSAKIFYETHPASCMVMDFFLISVDHHSSITQVQILTYRYNDNIKWRKTNQSSLSWILSFWQQRSE